MTIYRSSDGRELFIRDMQNGHLHNALRRLMDDARSPTFNRQPELEALTAEVVRRAKAEDVGAMSDDQLVARFRLYRDAPWRGALDDAGVISALMTEAERRDAERAADAH